MTNKVKMIASGILSVSLFLGCIGCGCSVPQVTTGSDKATVTKDLLPSVTVTGAPISPHLLQLDNLTAAPVYPEIPQCPQIEDYADNMSQFYEDQWQWQSAVRETRVCSPDNAHDLDPFMKAAMEQFLSGDDNTVCAPLNIYFALAMLAQTTDGNSRQQILDLLGHDSIESLREQAKQLWIAHYYNDGQTTSLMANSVWLDEAYTFYQDTLDTLATEYFASAFYGDLGTEEMDKQLAAWLDAQTGGLLNEYTENIKLSPAAVFCLASTAFFQADWVDSFYKPNTYPEVFHAEDQDVTTDFMHTTYMEYLYYEGNYFSAVALGLSGEHQMWLILPHEGSSPQELLAQGDYYDLISSPDTWERQRRVTLNLSMPKFDVSNEQDMIPGLKAMGITDVFNAHTADFSPLSDTEVFLSTVTHAARVAVDETGVIAAAYTLMVGDTGGMPEQLEEVDFILDRPFLFAITGSDDLPLFAGTVNQPFECTQSKYCITIADSPLIDAYLITDDLESSYAPGEEVTIQLATITGHYYVLTVNGVSQAMDMDASDLMYTYFTFTMPNQDVLIEIQQKAATIPAAP